MRPRDVDEAAGVWGDARERMAAGGARGMAGNHAAAGENRASGGGAAKSRGGRG